MTAKQRCEVALSMLARHLHREISHRVIVLCYHSIHPTKSFRSATPELFAQHLNWFKEHCEIVRFSQVFETAKAERLNRPALAITIDDGIDDSYEYAFPLLEKYAIPATFFITVGLLEKEARTLRRFRKLYRAPDEDIRPLRWSQVCELQRAGMEIGSHTFSHPNLARLDQRSVEVELKRSKEVIEQRVGEQITSLAYPFGIPRIHFSSETADVVAEVGYKVAAAVLFRPLLPDSSRLAIPRYLVMNDEIETLRDKVFGVWDFHGIWQEKGPIWAARIISPSWFVGESCTQSPLSAGSADDSVV